MLRRGRGWSQMVLAEKAGLHPTYIGGIERGERNLSLVNLDRLAHAFGITLADLFVLAESLNAEASRREVPLCRKLKTLLGSVRPQSGKAEAGREKVFVAGVQAAEGLGLFLSGCMACENFANLRQLISSLFAGPQKGSSSISP